MIKVMAPRLQVAPLHLRKIRDDDCRVPPALLKRAELELEGHLDLMHVSSSDIGFLGAHIADAEGSGGNDTHFERSLLT